MSEKKTSEAQIKAVRKYEANNPERKRYTRKKSNAKNFILKTVTAEDMIEVEKWMNERKVELANAEQSE